jgi:light-regulated signal transduction histidine kinase (bacteriophytochrome)
MATIFGFELKSSAEGFALVYEDDAEEHRAKVQRIAREGGSYFSEFRIRRRDTGEVVWLEERARAIVDESGCVNRVVGVLTDFTARKAAEDEMRQRNAELERANSELEEFAYVTSHDLQEPLRTINIYTDLLLRQAGLQNYGQLGQFAEFIHGGVKRMELLISDLLSYARVVHREQEPAAAVAIRDVIADAETIVQGLTAETGALIEYEGNEAVVFGDPRQLAQVFQNLFSNSNKYRRKETAPHISVHTQSADGEWIISLNDNGIGFDPQYSQRIFGLFKSLHKHEYPGTYLGLAICKRIVERYGGRIWATSEGEGRGATFFVALKAADRENSGPSAEVYNGTAVG